MAEIHNFLEKKGLYQIQKFNTDTRPKIFQAIRESLDEFLEQDDEGVIYAGQLFEAVWLDKQIFSILRGIESRNYIFNENSGLYTTEKHLHIKLEEAIISVDAEAKNRTKYLDEQTLASVDAGQAAIFFKSQEKLLKHIKSRLKPGEVYLFMVPQLKEYYSFEKN